MFDPLTLNDPEAMRTEWSPLEPGGASFTTHALREHVNGLQYRKNLRMIFFAMVFVLLGLVVTLSSIEKREWVGLLGLIFFGSGVWMLWPTKVVFDRIERTVTVGARVIPFSEIVALQLLTERIRGNKNRDYDSHELNLVLRDGSRVNAVDHAGRQVLREDMRRLRELIGCRAWDGSTS